LAPSIIQNGFFADHNLAGLPTSISLPIQTQLGLCGHFGRPLATCKATGFRFTIETALALRGWIPVAWGESSETPVSFAPGDPHCERLTGSKRRESIDFLIPLSEGHLRKTLNASRAHGNKGRPHLSLGPALPEPEHAFPVPVQKCRYQLQKGYRVKSRAVLGGLHHECWLEKIAA
jgi:hypothetical protein